MTGAGSNIWGITSKSKWGILSENKSCSCETFKTLIFWFFPFGCFYRIVSDFQMLFFSCCSAALVDWCRLSIELNCNFLVKVVKVQKHWSNWSFRVASQHIVEESEFQKQQEKRVCNLNVFLHWLKAGPLRFPIPLKIFNWFFRVHTPLPTKVCPSFVD